MSRPQIKKLISNATVICPCGERVKLKGCTVGSNSTTCAKCGASIVVRVSAGCFAFRLDRDIGVNDGWLAGADRIEDGGKR
jgi:hypothetical protein